MSGAWSGAKLGIGVVLTLVACAATAFIVVVLAPPLSGSQGVWLAVEQASDEAALDLELDAEAVEAWAPELADALRRAASEGEAAVTGTGAIDESLGYLRRLDASHEASYTVAFEGQAYVVSLRTG